METTRGVVLSQVKGVQAEEIAHAPAEHLGERQQEAGGAAARWSRGKAARWVERWPGRTCETGPAGGPLQGSAQQARPWTAGGDVEVFCSVELITVCPQRATSGNVGLPHAVTA